MGQEDFKKIASQKYKEVTEILSTRLDTQMPTPCYLTEEERNVIIDALEDKERMWVDHNKVIMTHGTDEQINHYIEKNKQAIEEINRIKDKLKL